MITFKPLTEADIPVIMPMMEQFYAIDGYPINTETSESLFSAFITDEKAGKSWLIYSGGKAAGYIILTFIFSFEYGGRIAFIDELFISQPFRGSGIGKAAIAFIQSEAAKLSLKLLYLEVEHHNSNAQKLYLAAGFSAHNRKLMQFKLNH